MVHHASGGENCQRLFHLAIGHRKHASKIRPGFLHTSKVGKTHKKRSERTFRADYHPHALEKSLFSCPYIRFARIGVFLESAGDVSYKSDGSPPRVSE